MLHTEEEINEDLEDHTAKQVARHFIRRNEGQLTEAQIIELDKILESIFEHSVEFHISKEIGAETCLKVDVCRPLISNPNMQMEESYLLPCKFIT